MQRTHTDKLLRLNLAYLLILQAASPSDTLQPLPVSAVALGKAPSRSDTIPTGSDVLLDALYEQEVAHQAQQFLNTEQGQAMLRNGDKHNSS